MITLKTLEKLIQTARENGAYDETEVVVTSDHRTTSFPYKAATEVRFASAVKYSAGGYESGYWTSDPKEKALFIE